MNRSKWRGTVNGGSDCTLQLFDKKAAVEGRILRYKSSSIKTGAVAAVRHVV